MSDFPERMSEARCRGEADPGGGHFVSGDLSVQPYPPLPSLAALRLDVRCANGCGRFKAVGMYDGRRMNMSTCCLLCVYGAHWVVCDGWASA